MKNRDDYFNENPGDSKAVDKSTQYVAGVLQTKKPENKPKLGDEADYAADGLDYGTDEEDYVIKEDDHYAG